MAKEIIGRPLHFDKVRDVYLNRNGVKIGQIVSWNGRRCYLTWRREEHYFRKWHGYAIDRGLFWNMIKDDRIDLIVIEYRGVKGLRYFISNIDDWATHSVPASHTKEVGNTLEAYGNQIVLNEDYMTELEVKQ